MPFAVTTENRYRYRSNPIAIDLSIVTIIWSLFETKQQKEMLHVTRAQSVPVSKETVWMMIMQQIVKNKQPGEKQRKYGETTNEWRLLRMKHRYRERTVFNVD
jgi:hypothetical protein